MMIYFHLLFIAALVGGNSGDQCPSCPSCHIPLDPEYEGEQINIDLVKMFHEDNIRKYCEIRFGKPCLLNDCDGQEICIEDNSKRGFTL